MLPSSLLFRRGDRVFSRSPRLKPLHDPICTDGASGISRPIAYRFRLSKGADENIPASVVSLLYHCRPPAVRRRIPAVIVYPVYREVIAVSVRDRPIAEGDVTVAPLVADRDTASTVTGELLSGSAKASVLHVSPDPIQAGMGAMLSGKRLCGRIPASPGAVLSFSELQETGRDAKGGPAMMARLGSVAVLGRLAGSTPDCNTWLVLVSLRPVLRKTVGRSSDTRYYGCAWGPPFPMSWGRLFRAVRPFSCLHCSI